MAKPTDIQLIGSELCIIWQDGSESFFPGEFLRQHSPSAQNIGATPLSPHDSPSDHLTQKANS